MAAHAKTREVTSLLIRFGIAGLFLYAGMIKLLDPEQLAIDIEGYHIVPEIVIPYMARFLTCLEILTGLALVVRKVYLGAVAILSGLMGVFTVALVISWIRGLDISCGCFGHHGDKSQYAWWVTRDLVLLTSLGYLLWMEYAKQLLVYSRSMASEDESSTPITR